MWLYYWLAAQGVHPLRDIESVVIPPPQMVAALAEDRLDGLCVGEPWNTVAQARGVGRTIAYSSEVWPDHPEKVLACRRDFASRHPHTARALVQTMLEACRWLDGAGHRSEIARWLARPDYIGINEALIAERLGNDTAASAPGRLPVRFFDDGAVNYPRPADGVWFLTQYERWGMIRPRGDYHEIAAAINQTDLYRDAATRMGIAIPSDDVSQVLIDARVWDGSDPAAYLKGFGIHA
jgi:nitrate/nitrite transport system substrate-binding protein